MKLNVIKANFELSVNPKRYWNEKNHSPDCECGEKIEATLIYFDFDFDRGTT